MRPDVYADRGGVPSLTCPPVCANQAAQRGCAEMNELAEIDAFIAAAFRDGASSAKPVWLGLELAEPIRSRIDYHGIAFALGERWRDLGSWPDEVVDWIKEQSRAQAFWEDSHRETFAALIGQLYAAGIDSLVLKGTALAYSVYEQPAMRRRGDTDLLIRKVHLNAARRILVKAGFQRRERLLTQEDWAFDTGVGFVHHLDLHWEFSNSPTLSEIFEVDELMSRADTAGSSLPRLHPAARAMDPVALFIHCSINQALHRKNGYYSNGKIVFGSDRLIWANDSHLLCGTFDDRQWQDLADLSERKNVGLVCLQALQLAHHHLGTAIPGGVQTKMGQPPCDSRVVDYIAGRDKFSAFTADLKATQRPGAKARFLLEKAFPTPGHMRERFPGSASIPLPLLYLWRLLAAPLKLLGKAAR